MSAFPLFLVDVYTLLEKEFTDVSVTGMLARPTGYLSYEWITRIDSFGRLCSSDEGATSINWHAYEGRGS